MLPVGQVRPIKKVIRGLALDTTTEEIQQELTKLDFQVLKVAQLISRRTQAPMPLFLIHLSPVSKSNEIVELNKLFYFRINIEEYRSTFRTQQCHQCQFFHHHSENCMMKPRCVKCADAHHTKDCTEGKAPFRKKN